MFEKKNWVSVAVVAGLGLGAGQAHAACTFGTPSEATLQGSFDTLLGSGVLDAANDCLAEGSEAQWETPNLAGATILLELAGNAGTSITSTTRRTTAPCSRAAPAPDRMRTCS